MKIHWTSIIYWADCKTKNNLTRYFKTLENNFSKHGQNKIKNNLTTKKSKKEKRVYKL